ncbi:MAG: hypothetical protein MK116_12475 [Phycisphaerales bacterium]|nr:hypothetical protein [Phycisphaerales bacterium]
MPATIVHAAPPDGIDRLTTATSLDSTQSGKIAAYAEYWGNRLGDSDPGVVQEARDRLTRPLRTVSGRPASLMFRTTYGKTLVPIMEKLAKGPSTYKSINAMQVASTLAIPSALSLLDDHVEPDLEKRPQVRLWAAIGIGRCLNADSIRTDKIKGSLRVIARSAMMETDPLVLRRELETLDNAVRNTRAENAGGEDLRKHAIKLEFDVVGKTIDRLEEGSAPASLLLALRPTLVLIRNQYIDPQLMREQRNIGLLAAPQLGRVYDILLVNEKDIRNDPELEQAAGQLIDSSETTLKLVDSHLRSGQSAPAVTPGRELWDQGNSSGLAESRDKWQVVLTARPYNN